MSCVCINDRHRHLQKFVLTYCKFGFRCANLLEGKYAKQVCIGIPALHGTGLRKIDQPGDSWLCLYTPRLGPDPN